ncbi:hypothetical protein WJX73_000209 [Symbiochloris irregularis]|uniref:ER membrane protein complex subunit 4 n=1 Tax=Symbiochloris irregularis TaxID=706552 RepID=A0AAW1P620_9CHLO
MADFRSWRVDFDANESALVRQKRVADPPGHDLAAARDMVAQSTVSTRSSLWKMKQQALYSRATGQVKNVGLMCFMMWMSGAQIHLFSIMMTVSGIYQPLSSIFKSGEMFPPESSEDGQLDTLRPRLLYIAIHIAALGFGLWKLAGMGLLPTNASDFVSAMSVPRALEWSAGSVRGL